MALQTSGIRIVDLIEVAVRDRYKKRALILALYVPRRFLAGVLNDSLIMEIDPRKVRYHVSSARPGKRKITEKLGSRKTASRFTKKVHRQILRVTNVFESFVIDSDYYEDVAEFDDFSKYRKVKNFIENRDDYKSSDWYVELTRSLKEKGSARHKDIVMRSGDDIDRFMQDYVLSLLESLEKDGFDRRKGGGLGRVLIGKDGSIHKCTSGRHRFYSSRILGIKPIPVRVAGVHEDWYREHVGNTMKVGKLKTAMAKVQQSFA